MSLVEDDLLQWGSARNGAAVWVIFATTYLVRFGLAVLLEGGFTLFSRGSLKNDSSVSGNINAELLIVKVDNGFRGRFTGFCARGGVGSVLGGIVRSGLDRFDFERWGGSILSAFT